MHFISNSTRRNETLLPAIIHDDHAEAIRGANNDAAAGHDLPEQPSAIPAVNISFLQEEPIPIPAANNNPDISARNNAGSFEEAIRAVSDTDAELQRYPVFLSQLRFDNDCLYAGDRPFRVDERGFKQLCQWLKAPADYLLHKPEALRASAIQHDLQSGNLPDHLLRDGETMLLARDNILLGLARGTLYHPPAAEVLQAVREGIGDDAATLRVQGFALDDQALRLYLDLVSPRVADEAAPGDILQGGLHLEYSFLADQATVIQPYVLRLACLNGATIRECLGEKHAKDSDKKCPARSTARLRRPYRDRADASAVQRQQIIDYTARTWRGLRAKLGSILTLHQERVDDHKKTFERLLRQYRLHSEQLMKRLVYAWGRQEGPANGFRLFNAITWLATHGHKEIEQPQPENEKDKWRPSPGQLRTLARLAGVFAQHRLQVCPACSSVIERS